MAKTTRRLTFAREGREPEAAKATARRSYQRARKVGGRSAVLADTFWSETLFAIDGHEPATQSEMWRRTEHLMVLLHDRAAWPR
jgi:hypothetical protein